MRRASRCKALWGDSVETMDVGAGHPFCGESLQQRVSAVCPTYAIIGDQARPPPISFDVGGGGGRVSRVKESVTQGVEFATSNAAAGPRVTRGPVAFGSGSATFSRDQGAQAMAFFACALPRPCSSGRPIRAGAPPTCVDDSTTSTPSAQLASLTPVLVRVSQQQQQCSTHSTTRLDYRPPTREPRMIE
jgi:hypothetical protein